MRRFICLAAFLLLALLPALGRAAELKDYSIKDEGKKLRFDFKFSDKVKTEVVSHYANNFVALSVTGLKFSKSQLRSDQKPKEKDQEAIFKYVRCVPGKDGGDAPQIRIYLVKPLTPADVLVVPYDTHVEVELMKPAGSVSSVPESDEMASIPASHSGSGKPADNSAKPSERIIPRPQDPKDPAAGNPTDEGSGEAGNGSGAEDPGFIADHRGETGAETGEGSGVEGAADEGAEASGEAESPETPETGGDESAGTSGRSTLGRLPGLNSGASSKPEDSEGSGETPEVESVGSSAEIGGRSYTSFDLSQVAVQSVEIRAQPFNEAIMELVAGTGFNVVVGEGISREPVTLNFTQKQISLKSALDLLCIAYDLEYTIEPDAIVIKSKAE